MIVEGLISIAIGLAHLLVDAMGTLDPPGFLTGLAGQMNGLVATGASMGNWVPWSTFGVAVSAVFACFAISFLVRITRILVSLFTGGGGSAA